MSRSLGGLQFAIMQVLWSHGSASVAEVQRALEGDHPLAYSTIATVLGRLERKLIVTHRTDGRTFVYQPLLSEDQISSLFVTDLLDNVFGGSPSQLVSYMLNREDIDVNELSRIRTLIFEYEQKRNGTEERPS